jgi:hypothetical protein
MPACLHPKLLSVCHQCYAPPGFDSSTIGWLAGDPGPCGTAVDSALVGRIGDVVVVAYRGTLAPGGPNVRDTIDDWINNAQARMVQWENAGVHHGFLDSHLALWGEVERAIEQRLAAGPSRAIVVTGHSKGGALAVLGATAIRRRWPEFPIHVVTFAAPRAGGRAFADAYAAMRIPTLRYENRADLVPNLPLGGRPSQPVVWTLLKALGVKSPVVGYVGAGEALIGGPGAFAVTLDWIGLAPRLIRTRNVSEAAVPLVEAHRIDRANGVYNQMVAQQALRCAGHGHGECQAT